MPNFDIKITKVWKHSSQSKYIHYTIERADGSVRHLVAKPGEPMLRVLSEHLAAAEYVGPRA